MLYILFLTNVNWYASPIKMLYKIVSLPWKKKKEINPPFCLSKPWLSRSPTRKHTQLVPLPGQAFWLFLPTTTFQNICFLSPIPNVLQENPYTRPSYQETPRPFHTTAAAAAGAGPAWPSHSLTQNQKQASVPPARTPKGLSLQQTGTFLLSLNGSSRHQDGPWDESQEGQWWGANSGNSSRSFACSKVAGPEGISLG